MTPVNPQDGVNEFSPESLPKTPEEIKDAEINAAVARLAPRLREELGMEEKIEALETNEATEEIVVSNVETARVELESVQAEIISVSTMSFDTIKMDSDGNLSGSPEAMAKFIQLQEAQKKGKEFRAIS